MAKREAHRSPHNTYCPGCHSCQPERFPNVAAGFCGCDVCRCQAMFNGTVCRLVVGHAGRHDSDSPVGGFYWTDV